MSATYPILLQPKLFIPRCCHEVSSLLYHGPLHGRTSAIKSAIICAADPHGNTGILSPFYTEKMSVAWKIRWPIVLVYLALNDFSLSGNFSAKTGIILWNQDNWSLYWESQKEVLSLSSGAMLQGTLGWGCSRLAADWHAQCLLSESLLPSVSPSVSLTHLSPLALWPGDGRCTGLPYPLLCWQNEILFFSHKLLGRRYTFFFVLSSFCIIKIFSRPLKRQARYFLLPGHIFSDSSLTAKP